MSEFYELVEKLTVNHHVTIHTDDGPRILKADGLIQQLRDAIDGGSDRGSTGGNKTKLPLNAPALDLYQLIDRQVSEVWAVVTRKVPSTDRTEALLSHWAAAVQEDQPVTYSTPETITRDNRDTVIWNPRTTFAIDLLRRWVTAIEEMFDPPRTAEITAACIACGERSMWRTVDGQDLKSPAFVFIRDRGGETTEARCLACGQSWVPSQFKYLAEAISKNEAAA